MKLNILRLDASARKTGSVSRDLTDQVVARFAGANVTTRDLSTPLPQIDEAWIGANFTPAADRTNEQRVLLTQSDTLVAELQAADVVVVGLPVYNFAPPAALKAWVDLVTRVGVTFQYGANSPEGLLTGKRAILVMASGGTAVGSAVDFASPYMRHILGFNGITDVDVVAADAMSIDAEAAINRAKAEVAALAA